MMIKKEITYKRKPTIILADKCTELNWFSCTCWRCLLRTCVCVCVCTPVKWRYTRCTLLIYINFLYDLFFCLSSSFILFYIIIITFIAALCLFLYFISNFISFFAFSDFFYTTFLIIIISFYFKTFQLPMQIYFGVLCTRRYKDDIFFTFTHL